MPTSRVCSFLGLCFLAISEPWVAAQSPAPSISEADSLDQEIQELFKTGKYSEVIPVATRLLALCEKTFGEEHPKTASSVSQLGMAYLLAGNYAKAEPLLQRGVTIREKVLGPEDSETANSLTFLAMLYQLTADYAKAEPLFQRALKINEKLLGPEHLGTAFSLNALGIVDQMMGDYAKAEPLYQRALKIYEKAMGPEHLSTAMGMNTLAMLYQTMGNYGKAEPLYQGALTIYEKTLGSEHPTTALGLNCMGQFYWKTHNYGKAEPFLQRALSINEKVRGPQHPETANSLTALALIYEDMGESAKAEPLYQRALEARERVLGPQHALTGISFENLALLKIAGGRSKGETLELMRRAHQAERTRLSNILSFTSEEQRLAFQKTTSPYDLAGTLGAPKELADMVLQQKCVVLDSLLEDRLVAEASNDPKQYKLINELRGLKQQLLKLELETAGDLSEQAREERAAKTKELASRADQLEGELARQIAGLGRARRALVVTTSQVQGTLGRTETLVELVRYWHYLGRHKFEGRYGAVVIPPKGEPKWVPLDASDRIEKSIQLYQKSARGKTDETTLSGALRDLYAQIWGPIEKALPGGTSTIIISPDGELSFVSFATLLGPDDKFLAEKYSIRYVASGRDLLRKSKSSNSQMMFVYANPDFEATTIAPASTPAGATTIAMRSLEMRDLESLYLRPLLGTQAEADALEKRGGKSVKVFLGPNATEAELRQVNSPRVLHLATHGFFLPEIDLGKSVDPMQPGQQIPKGKLVNPMHRSGLALAGAQSTLEAWGRGEVPPTENDGIVTAEEVGGLKLDGTWLVVLSACDTGSGEVRAGEGVMGLRRGFVEAGAQNLLMTLWPIDDQMTVQIMIDFYNAAEKTRNAPQALADVQRDWLVKLRKERDLLDAFRLAGPFIMSSQGKQ